MQKILHILKLTPEFVFKPWGLVHGEALRHTSIEIGVGEIWLASAQRGPGNVSNRIAEPKLGITLAEVLEEAQKRGEGALGEMLGETALEGLRSNPHRGKTEAWYFRAAGGRTGMAGGPRTQEHLERLGDLILSGSLRAEAENWSDEVRDCLGVTEPIKAGETFLVPCGTMHTMFAIGEESHIIVDEIQQGYGESLLPTLSKMILVQNSLESVQVHPGDELVAKVAAGEVEIEQDFQANPTVRLYDFGRRPGELPELGLRLIDLNAGMRKVGAIAVETEDGLEVEFMVADSHLVKSRLRLAEGRSCAVAPHYGSYHVLHCLRGTARLCARDDCVSLSAGETALVPGAFEERLRMETDAGCELFDHTFPRLDVLRDFMSQHGVEPERLKSFLNPSRSL